MDDGDAGNDSAVQRHEPELHHWRRHAGNDLSLPSGGDQCCWHWGVVNGVGDTDVGKRCNHAAGDRTRWFDGYPDGECVGATHLGGPPIALWCHVAGVSNLRNICWVWNHARSEQLDGSRGEYGHDGDDVHGYQPHPRDGVLVQCRSGHVGGDLRAHLRSCSSNFDVGGREWSRDFVYPSHQRALPIELERADSRSRKCTTCSRRLSGRSLDQWWFVVYDADSKFSLDGLPLSWARSRSELHLSSERLFR